MPRYKAKPFLFLLSLSRVSSWFYLDFGIHRYNHGLRQQHISQCIPNYCNKPKHNIRRFAKVFQNGIARDPGTCSYGMYVGNAFLRSMKL